MGRGIRRILLFLILMIALGFRLRGITNPLLDDQAWRQADTACIATHMLGRLPDIPQVFIPKLNYDGVIPQKVELEFPFLPYLLAWTWRALGWADIWGRLWAVVFSLLTVLGIYDLGRNLFSDRAGLLAAAIYALMPLSIYYGRVVMPEPVAQALSIWALASIWRWRRTPKESKIWIAALLMTGAVLAKLPQLMIFPVALLLGFWPLNRKHFGQVLKYCLLALLPPVVYYLWVHVNVSSANRFVSGIVTTQVVNGGHLDYKQLIKHLRQGFMDSVLFLTCVGIVRVSFNPSTARTVFLAWLGIAVLYTGVVCLRIPFDYYLVPVLPLAALLSGYTLDGIHKFPETMLVLALLIMVNQTSYTYLSAKYDWNPNYLTQAQWIREHTPASSVLLLSDPEPMTLYYAHRVGFRLTKVLDNNTSIELLSHFPAGYFVWLPQSRQNQLFLKKTGIYYPEIGPGIFALNSR